MLFKEEDDLAIKIIDFGISGICTADKAEKVDAGSLTYMAPECFLTQNPETTPALDVWAIGLMFYAMLYGTLPFFANTEEEMMNKIKKAPIKYDSSIPLTKEGKHVL